MLAVLANPASAQRPDFTVPPYGGVYQPQGVDERGIWMDADEDERAIRDSHLRIRDSALNDYVRSVLCAAVGEERCRSVRIYIMRVPYFQATMAPNGMLIIWSGLLLRSRNEAELAYVLGHEFAHFERRHGLRGYRAARSATDILAWMAVLSAMGARTYDARVLTIGAYHRFGRDQEREADILGLSYLKHSTYQTGAAARIWTRMMDEVDATALGRAQRSRRYDRTPFFASHPTNIERATYLSELAGPDVPDRVEGGEAYRAALRPWLGQFLEDQIRLNDFGGTEFLLGQLAETGWTAELLYARGELYRMRGNPRDLVNAADFYRQSIALDATRAEAFRGLGLALLRAQVPEEGRQALARYLALKPDASDAAMIRMLAGQGS